ARPHDRAGSCVVSSDAARAPRRRDARRHAAALGPAQCRHGDARGLEVSPGAFLRLIGAGRITLLPAIPDASRDLVSIYHVIGGLIEISSSTPSPAEQRTK